MATTVAPKVRFVFANVDGVKLELQTEPTMTVLDVKRWIVAEWAKLEGRPAPPEPEGVRLICMGVHLDDRKTIKDCKLPVFAHPTPINVSMLPAGQTYTKPSTLPEIPSGKKQGSSSGGAGSHANNNSSSQQGSSCCVIL